jgi:hypothetical protein
VVAENALPIGLLFTAAILMALAHYLFSELPSLVFNKLKMILQSSAGGGKSFPTVNYSLAWQPLSFFIAHFCSSVCISVWLFCRLLFSRILRIVCTSTVSSRKPEKLPKPVASI